MKKLKISLENCFGIGKFEHEFEFCDKNVVLIYAPNGTMKTSFSKTFKAISKNTKKEQPKDFVFNNRKTSYDINYDNKKISPEAIFVIDPDDEDYDSSSKITTFLASNDLKKQYESIYQSLNEFKSNFLKRLKDVSKSTDCEKELMQTFKQNEEETFFSILDIINTGLEVQEKNTKYDFKYNDVFDSKGKIKEFLNLYKDDIKMYFDQYMEILKQSSFFKILDGKNMNFGTVQANQLNSAVNDNTFFDAGHKILLHDNTSIDASGTLKSRVDFEVSKILSDSDLKEIFNKIDSALAKNIELKAFKQAIEKNNMLLLELNDYDNFRKKVWYGFIQEINESFKGVYTEYKDKKSDLNKIIADAQKEQEKWKEIIDLFEQRFHVPFKIEIKNQKDVVLGNTTSAILSFKFQDECDNIDIEKESLLKTLSKGESRAFYMLQVLFELQARKTQSIDHILICDDISDSFDYKNKYAIIEYLQELSELNHFKMILLTHNFDFYRTIASRFGLRRDHCFMAIKDNNRIITLKEGQYIKNLFNIWITNLVTDNNKFIASIPLVRNLSEYMTGQDDEQYKKLTACLHLKDETTNLTVKGVFDIFKNIIPRIKYNLDQNDLTKSILNFILDAADKIRDQSDIDLIMIENKIVLSIAIRLKAERFMMNTLSITSTQSIVSNQTFELFKKFKESFHDDHRLSTLKKVNLMTPEHIHINAFMYEPLIDMSVQHLIDLYNEVAGLS